MVQNRQFGAVLPSPAQPLPAAHIRRISRGATTAELSPSVTKRRLARQVAGRGVPGYARLAYVGAQRHNGVIGDAVRGRLL
jgi:hypothetical protein